MKKSLISMAVVAGLSGYGLVANASLTDSSDSLISQPSLFVNVEGSNSEKLIVAGGRDKGGDGNQQGGGGQGQGGQGNQGDGDGDGDGDRDGGNNRND